MNFVVGGVHMHNIEWSKIQHPKYCTLWQYKPAKLHENLTRVVQTFTYLSDPARENQAVGGT